MGILERFNRPARNAASVEDQETVAALEQVRQEIVQKLADAGIVKGGSVTWPGRDGVARVWQVNEISNDTQDVLLTDEDGKQETAAGLMLARYVNGESLEEHQSAREASGTSAEGFSSAASFTELYAQLRARGFVQTSAGDKMPAEYLINVIDSLRAGKANTQIHHVTGTDGLRNRVSELLLADSRV